MLNNYITLNKTLMPNAAKIIANEFYSDPIITYILPNEDTRSKVLPLIFENLLELYENIGETYISNSNIDITFSLIDSNSLDRKFSLYSSIMKLIPSMLKPITSLPFIETSKRLNNVKGSLKDLTDFIKAKEEFIFISSIGIKNHLNEDALLKNMLESLIDYSNTIKKDLLMESNSLEMIKLYQKYNFKVVIDSTIDYTNIHAYLLSYTP